MPLSDNIALIGFMGSGKTTVGRAVADRLGWDFADTDVSIERAAGVSIPVLFEREGEAAFREREALAVAAACEGQRRVIATGGGAVLRETNASLLRKTCFVVWLTARAEVVAARTAREAHERPILAAAGETDLLTHILRLLGERSPRYQAAAHLIVDTSDRTPDAIAAEIVRKWERESR
jgi:shikimate kinase